MEDLSTKLVNAVELLSTIRSKKEAWDERSSFKIKRVSNLSSSDLDTLEMYAQCIYRYGTYQGRLMQPYGGVGDVLKEYGLWD